jgi:hypothetical protein
MQTVRFRISTDLNGTCLTCGQAVVPGYKVVDLSGISVPRLSTAGLLIHINCIVVSKKYVKVGELLTFQQIKRSGSCGVCRTAVTAGSLALLAADSVHHLTCADSRGLSLQRSVDKSTVWVDPAMPGRRSHNYDYGIY